ncbi:hypothetical protein [Sedimenticola selenatireducens]|uniref:Uncharacterized protein n=1 Tax=Sedimenticola selenatireducens TaxID=191960 RepID=A0A558DX23_9GAMM|nr:hypothetical protein [Sedimenticola selenatireducens]TVO75557.1 hypothetical protein FHP88_08675 [Sedimenticola selenatireducens]TVT65463.1 MAG: hypothetical protein FHK78_04460 [Sedimenticola selenatireducens]
MNDDWLTDSFKSEDETEETPLSLDHQGIPILNEIVDPESIQTELPINTLQQDLIFLTSEPTNQDEQARKKQALIRSELIEEIRTELLAAIETTSQAVADKIRDDLTATLRDTLTEAVEKRLQAISEVETDNTDHPKP